MSLGKDMTSCAPGFYIVAACGQLCGFCRYCIDMYRLYRWYLFQHVSNAYLILVKVAMLQDLLLRGPFHDQAKELTLADLAKERRVEKRQAGLKIEVPVEPGCVAKRKCLKDINGL